MKYKDYEGVLIDRNIEIFELEEKIKKLSIYKVMYFKKNKELERVKMLLESLEKIATDEIKTEIKSILEEIGGTRYR